MSKLGRILNRKTVVVALVGVGVWYGLYGKWGTRSAPETNAKKTLAPPPELAARAELRAAREGYAVVISGGRLDRILKPAGSVVQENEIIAVVDETARKTQLETALSRFKLAKVNFERVKRLYRSGATSREEYDEASSTFTVRTAELKAAKQELNNSLVRAPLAGTVSVVAYQIGDVTPDGARVAIVEDRESFRLRLSMPLESIEAFGDRVTVRLPDSMGSVDGDLRYADGPNEGPTDVTIEIHTEIPDRLVGRWIDVTLVGKSPGGQHQSRLGLTPIVFAKRWKVR